MLEYLLSHRVRLLGILIGVVVGILWATVGFWRMLLVAVLTLAGFIIGMYLEDRDRFRQRIDKILPDWTHRRDE